jgi:hypothetical protein
LAQVFLSGGAAGLALSVGFVAGVAAGDARRDVVLPVVGVVAGLAPMRYRASRPVVGAFAVFEFGELDGGGDGVGLAQRVVDAAGACDAEDVKGDLSDVVVRHVRTRRPDGTVADGFVYRRPQRRHSSIRRHTLNTHRAVSTWRMLSIETNRQEWRP